MHSTFIGQRRPPYLGGGSVMTLCIAVYFLVGSASAQPQPPTTTKSPHGSTVKLDKGAVTKTRALPARDKVAFDSALMMKEWRCLSTQPMMEIDAKETFLKDQTAKGEGRLTFSWIDGTQLHLFLESTGRWRIDAGKLCDVPTSMHFTQMSGVPNPHVDKLMAAMQAQANQRMSSNLETCRRIKSLSETELVLVLPSQKGEVETRCTPLGASKDEK